MDTWVSAVGMNGIGRDETTGKFVLVTNGICMLPHAPQAAHALAHVGTGCRIVPLEGLVFDTGRNHTVRSWQMENVRDRVLHPVDADVEAKIRRQFEEMCDEIAKTGKAVPRMEPLYFPNWLLKAVADETMTALMALPWLEVTDARKEYFMSDVPRSYAYGKGDFRRTYDSAPYSPEVAAIRNSLNRLYGTDYNVCFLNRYDDQRNQLGWHADDSPEMDGTHPISVVSFGAEREIWWRPTNFKGTIPEAWRQKLGHGSWFEMPAGFQAHYQHRIPKCDRAVGVRVSLTFRKYVEPKKEPSDAVS